MVIIKKYSNRRLYDTEDSRYITLEELYRKVRAGSDIRVLDARSNEDLTQATLAQIVIENRGAARMLPVPMLVQMIRMGDDALADFLGRYVTWALSVYGQLRANARAAASMSPASMFSMNPWAARMPWAGGAGWPGQPPQPQQPHHHQHQHEPWGMPQPPPEPTQWGMPQPPAPMPEPPPAAPDPQRNAQAPHRAEGPSGANSVPANSVPASSVPASSVPASSGPAPEAPTSAAAADIAALRQELAELRAALRPASDADV